MILYIRLWIFGTKECCSNWKRGESDIQMEDIFNVIHQASVSIRPKEINRMIKDTGKKFKNITPESMFYPNLCIPCL